MVEHHNENNERHMVSNGKNTNLVFHSYFADKSAQNAVMTHAHMHVVLQHYMHTKKVFFEKSTMWENTDGCSKQY